MEVLTKKEGFKQTCELFIDVINNYFINSTDQPCEMGIPYLKTSDQDVLRDYTGMIGVSGSQKGMVYITADENLYKHLIANFIDLETPKQDDILDMAGELANTIVGNLRKAYGSHFMISVPLVFCGHPEKLEFPADISILVIPITWYSFAADVVISIA